MAGWMGWSASKTHGRSASRAPTTQGARGAADGESARVIRALEKTARADARRGARQRPVDGDAAHRRTFGRGSCALPAGGTHGSAGAARRRGGVACSASHAAGANIWLPGEERRGMGEVHGDGGDATRRAVANAHKREAARRVHTSPFACVEGGHHHRQEDRVQTPSAEGLRTPLSAAARRRFNQGHRGTCCREAGARWKVQNVETTVVIAVLHNLRARAFH